METTVSKHRLPVIVAASAALLAVAALAGEPKKIDLNVRNAVIQELQTRMAARAAKLDAWKQKGAIGEEASGLVAQRAVAGVGLAEKKEIHNLVTAENEDRSALFRELALANGLTEKDLGAVAAAFAATKRAPQK